MLGALVKHWSERFLLPDRVLQRTYEAFKSLLVHDGASHNLMAEFEELYHDGRREDFSRTRRRYLRMAAAVEGMVSELERMNPGQAAGLRDYLKKYDFYARLLLEPPEQFLIPPFAVFWALVERSRWSTVIMGVAALSVAIMVWRMNVIWTTPAL